MKRVNWMGILSVLLSSLAGGTVVSVPPEGLGSFVLDIDSDGFAEFRDFGYSAQENTVFFGFHVDGIDSITTFPDEDFVGIRAKAFSSTAELVSSTMFSGDLTVPVGYTRLYDSIQGYGWINPSLPLFAAWMYGSLGSGSEELRLLAMVVDATNFFNSGGSADLQIYFHDYGSFAGGEGISGASLSRTGINTGASTQLNANVEFIGPKSGLIRVASKSGRTYHLKKGDTPNDGVIIATLMGTGGVLTLSWDDTNSDDAKAFFWVEEITP